MGVEFEKNPISNMNYQQKKNSGITAILIGIGFAKDEAGAKKVMIAISVICIALAVYLAFK